MIPFLQLPTCVATALVAWEVWSIASHVGPFPLGRSTQGLHSRGRACAGRVLRLTPGWPHLARATESKPQQSARLGQPYLRALIF